MTSIFFLIILQVKDELDAMVIYDFPSNSLDLPVGSSLYNDYILALDTLLHILKTTGSLIVSHSNTS